MMDEDDELALVLSTSEDATADYLCERFDRARISYRRFNTDSPLDAVRLRLSPSGLEIEWAEQVLRPDQIQSVIYRRPRPFEPPIEGDAYQRRHAADEWAEAVEGFLAHIPHAKWINHPGSNFGASHKVHQLTSALACGLRVPAWLVTTQAVEAGKFLERYGPEVIAKPLASGYIERSVPESDTLIYTQLIDRSHTAALARLAACPVLFQERIEKSVDVRLVVIDDKIVACTLAAKESDGRQRLDIRRDNMRDVRYAVIGVPDSVASGVRALMSRYRLRFAAMDFAIDCDESWVFFEINPNGQWAWLDLAGVCDILPRPLNIEHIYPAAYCTGSAWK